MTPDAFEAYDTLVRLRPDDRREFEQLALSGVSPECSLSPTARAFFEMVLACRGRVLVGESATVH